MIHFLEFKADQLNYEQAKVVILPVPFEASVTYGKGTARGPEAILNASSNLEHYDTKFKKKYPAHGIFTLPLVQETASYPKMAEIVKS